MLVLRRKPEQAVYLDYPGGRIKVVYAGHTGRDAYIGFDAPAEVVIVREELERG